MIEKQPSPNPGRVLVTFRVDRSIWAEQVALVGDFDGCGPRKLPMLPTRSDPDWHLTIELDTGRQYRFAYLVDDRQWVTDNHADDYLIDSESRICGLIDTSVSCLPPEVLVANLEAQVAWPKPDRAALLSLASEV